MVGYFAIISSAKLHKSRETGLELNLKGDRVQTSY